jgi:hypothetical protein
MLFFTLDSRDPGEITRKNKIPEKMNSPGDP